MMIHGKSSTQRSAMFVTKTIKKEKKITEIVAQPSFFFTNYNKQTPYKFINYTYCMCILVYL